MAYIPTKFVRGDQAAVAETVEDYWQYLWEGWHPVGTGVPLPGRNTVSAKQSDLDALEARVAASFVPRTELAASYVPKWKPSATYSANDVVTAPDGSIITRVGSGTSRATFDATEQAAWATSISKAGTLAKVALDAAFAPLSTGRHDVRRFGAIGDFVLHPLSERFATLAEAQAVYPRATSLGDAIDWCAIQTCLDQTGAAYLSSGPAGTSTYVVNRGVRLDSTTSGRVIWGEGSQIVSTATTGVILNIGDKGGVRLQNIGVGFSGSTPRTDPGAVCIQFVGTFTQTAQFVGVHTFMGYTHWNQAGGAAGEAAVYSCTWRDCEASRWTGIAFDISTAFGMTSNRVDNFYAHNNPSGGGHAAEVGAAAIGGFRARGWQAGAIDNVNVEHCAAPFMVEIDSCPGSSIRSLYMENCEVTADNSSFLLLSANNLNTVPVHGNLVVVEGLTISYSRFLSSRAPTAVGIVKTGDGVQADVRSLVEHDNTVTAPNAFLAYGQGATSELSIGQYQTAGGLALTSYSPPSQVKRVGGDSLLAAAQGVPFTAGLYYPPLADNATTFGFSNATGRGGVTVVGRSTTLTRIGVEVATVGSAGALLRLGVYKINPGTGAASLLVDAGTIDATVVGWAEKTISVPVSAGDVLIGFAVSQGGATTQPIVRGSTVGWNPFTVGGATPLTVSQNVTLGSGASGVTGALPSTHTLSGVTSIPRVLLRAG